METNNLMAARTREHSTYSLTPKTKREIGMEDHHHHHHHCRVVLEYFLPSFNIALSVRRRACSQPGFQADKG